MLVSLDDVSGPRLSRLIQGLVGAGASAQPDAPWDETVRLSCQVLIRAGSELRALHLDGPSVDELAVGTRLLHLMDRAKTIAREYGLQARIDGQHGHVRVTLQR
jgi:hypothetical protein